MKKTIAITAIFLILSIASIMLSPNIRSTHASAFLDPVLARAASITTQSAVVRVIVTLDHIPTASDTQGIRQYSSATVGMTQLPMILTVTTYGSLASILAYPGVVSVWADRQVAYFGTVVTHSYGEIPVQHSWWNDIMRVPDVWNLGFQGQGVTVAVVDSGVDATNPSLGYNFQGPPAASQAPYRIIQNVKVFTVGEIVGGQPIGPDQIYLENQPNTDTTGGHGTSVSGLIAGTGDASNGVYKGAAPKANIVGLGAGDTEFIFHIVASYNYILAHRVQYNIKVVNNSWGTDFNCSDNLGQPTHDCDPGTPIQQATKAAHDAGTAVFFAAGNSGPTHPTINPFAEPAWVVGVGAGTQSKGLTEFSSRGVPTDPTKQPSIVAPGINVISTKAKTGATDNPLLASTDAGNIITAYQPYYTTFGGTSAASPMASGVAALILSASNLSPDQLKAALIRSTEPMLGYLPYQAGTGYTNALSAVRTAIGQGFSRTSIPVQAFGDQRFIYTQFIGGAGVITAAWLSASVPVFNGALNMTFKASFPVPASSVLQWESDIYGPNDYAVADCGVTRPKSDCIFARTGDTSMNYKITNSTFIASLNNPGFNSGTWDVRVLNFDQGSQVTLTVDINYPATGPPPPPGCTESDGNGDFQGQQRGNFNFDNDGCMDGDEDNVQSTNRGDGRDFQSTSINNVRTDSVAHTMTITGVGVSGGLPVAFVFTALETSSTTPGWVSFSFSDGYTNSGLLINGSIVLH
ncbi:MAG TPA: S8 family serine peptidase [Candidatus Bathyarchaeia archaeon]|nr:S8 family serine peptidase [Candidatus Bathyarchaeia archaeon]